MGVVRRTSYGDKGDWAYASKLMAGAQLERDKRLDICSAEWTNEEIIEAYRAGRFESPRPEDYKRARAALA